MARECRDPQPSFLKMPWKPAKPCLAQGCPNLVNGSAYCPAHRKLTSAARYDRERRPTVAALAIAARIRSGRQWQKVRALHRALEPLCADPFHDHANARRVALNEQSHHVLPLATHPHLAYDLANLAPLCAACHGKVERLERAGKATAGLFAAEPAQEGIP